MADGALPVRGPPGRRYVPPTLVLICVCPVVYYGLSFRDGFASAWSSYACLPPVPNREPIKQTQGGVALR